MNSPHSSIIFSYYLNAISRANNDLPYEVFALHGKAPDRYQV